jgi:pyruvate dehydrogenase E2 component (dihydrolipoamide acetyltransferase)
VLKYKRLDGVQPALRSLADHLFADGHQQHRVGDALGSFSGPVLVVWGEQDQVIPVAHAEAAPAGAETKVLPGAGHSPHMEAAGEFNRVIEGFLAGAHAG